MKVSREGRRRFWLNEMPIDVREKIAKEASQGGRYTDEALKIALTSKLQRNAVMASMSRSLSYELCIVDDMRTKNLSAEWVDLLVDHVRSLNIDVCFKRFFLAPNPHDMVFESSFLSQVLRVPHLEKAVIPGT